MRFLRWVSLAFLATVVFCGIALLTSKAEAGGDPVNVLLVVNSESASSKLIANHYIHNRGIPAINVVYLNGIPKGELIPLEIFKTRILTPVIKAIETRRIQDHIDYIVYSSGFPSQINCARDFRKLVNSIQKKGSVIPVNKNLLRANVSINAATYFYQQFLSGDPTYLSLSANHYYSLPIRDVLKQPFDGKDQEKYEEAIRNIKKEQLDQAIESLKELSEKHPSQVAVSYWLARAYGWQEDAENAALWLRRSMVGGWVFQDLTKVDTAFAKILEEPEFQKTLKLMPNQRPTYMPTRGFRNRYAWGPNGARVSSGTGTHYVISTVLAINRNKGNSEKQSLDQLLQTIGADSTRPKGKFYFSKTDDVRTKTRFNAFDDVIYELKTLGYESEIVTSRLPKNKKDVVGASVGTPSFSWERSRSNIIPGAIVENLTSFGGVMHQESGQTKLTAFIRNGAAGSSGTVVEPFAIQAKFPHPRIHLHYVRGCTLGEAFYQSVYGPFQLLIVGDPLCSPWAVPASLDVSSVQSGDEALSGEVEFTLKPAKDSARIAGVDLFMDGIFVRSVKESSLKLNTKSLSDGHHEMRLVTTAVGIIETRDSVVVPLNIDNNGHSVSVSAEKDTYHTSNNVVVTVKAPGASELQLRHNWTILSKKKGVEKFEFRVPASQLGRGPVMLNGFAIIDGTYIQSPPLELTIEGKIRESIPTVRSTWDPKPKPPKVGT